MKCGYRLVWWLRWLARGKSVLEGLAFVATTVAIIFLWISVKQTQSSLEFQQKALADQHQAFLVADSTTREQLQLLRESNEIDRTQTRLAMQQNEVDRAKFMESEKPQLVVDRLDCKLTNDTLTLLYRVENRGNTTASDVSITYDVAPLHNEINTQSATRHFTAVYPHEIIVLPQGTIRFWEMASRVKATWEWNAFGKKYEATSYHDVRADSTSKTCSCKLVPDSEARPFWLGRH